MKTLLLLVMGLGAIQAQQPRVSNAVFETRPVSANVANAIHAVASAHKTAWIGYSVPAVSRSHNSCCYHSSDGWGWRGCWLEGNRSVSGPPAASGGPVLLEGASQIMILFRTEQGTIEKVRSFTSDCELDAGGLPFVWLTGISPASSVAYLESFLATTPGDRRRLTESAIAAIALHGAPEASAVLEKAAQSGPRSMREKALFWLANAHGARGYEVVSRAAREDADDKVREHAIFALTQSREHKALETIISIARTDKNPRVRQKALFWLGQSKDPRAYAFIEHVLSK